MIANIFLCLVVLVEAGGFPVFLLTTAQPQAWQGLIGSHVLISFAIGWLGRKSLPKHYQQPPWGVVGFFTGFSLFIPMLGAIGVATLVFLAGSGSAASEKRLIRQVRERRYTARERSDTPQLASGDLSGRLTASSIPTQIRLNTLGKLQAFESRHISATLRGAFDDETEEVRLIAFGTLDQKEKVISARISQELNLYKQATHAQVQAEHARQIAYAYWELVYTDVVQADVAMHALSQAKHYAALVLRIDDRDAGMWALLGQVHLRLQEWDSACTSLINALDIGISETRVVPYLAEIAFRQREFSALPQFLANTKVLAEVPLLQPVVEYWRGKGS